MDVMFIFEISWYGVYNTFNTTMDSTIYSLSLCGVPFDDETALNSLSAGFISAGFSSSRACEDPLVGCVRALDAIKIKISKRRDLFMPRNYYCRKGLYPLPFEAVVDSHHRFMAISSVICGSTHDSLAFSAYPYVFV